jgi:hypothetical protein
LRNFFRSMARSKTSPPRPIAIPRPITIEHEREFRVANSPSLASGVYTPTVAKRFQDITKSAIFKKKPPAMVESKSQHSSSPESKKKTKKSKSKIDFFRRSQSLRRSKTIRRVSSTALTDGNDIPSESEMPPPLSRSPVMLVRRRATTARVKGSSPIRRFLKFLFRKRSRPQFNFTKQQLRKQLSFEVIQSPSKPGKYRIKSIDIFRLHPKPRKAVSNSSSDGGGAMVSPHPVGNNKTAIESTSPIQNQNQLDGFDFDYREKPPQQAETIHSVTVPRRSSKRQGKVRRTSSKRSTILPIIRRIDVFGAENFPDAWVASPPEFDEASKVDEALAFVSTWSSYLRRAIAVRVVLRQEIHSWELQEEERWRRSMESSSASSSYQTDPSETTTTASSSPRLSHSTSVSSSSFSSQSTSSGSRADNRSQSDWIGQLQEPRTASRLPRPTMTPIVGSPAVQDKTTPTELQLKRQSLRQSLDQARLAQKYASLVCSPDNPRNRSSSDSVIVRPRPSSEPIWLTRRDRIRRPNTTQQRPLPAIPIRKGDVVRMVSSPAAVNVGSSFGELQQQEQQQQQQQQQQIDSILHHESMRPSQSTDRTEELPEVVSPLAGDLRTGPAKTSQLVPSPQQPIYATEMAARVHNIGRTSRSTATSDMDIDAEVVTELKRGGLNRRRPRSQMIDNRRLSIELTNQLESSWSRHDSDSSKSGNFSFDDEVARRRHRSRLALVH